MFLQYDFGILNGVARWIWTILNQNRTGTIQIEYIELDQYTNLPRQQLFMPNLLSDTYGKNDLSLGILPHSLPHSLFSHFLSIITLIKRAYKLLKNYVILNDSMSHCKFNLDLQVMSKHDKRIMGFLPEVCVSNNNLAWMG